MVLSIAKERLRCDQAKASRLLLPALCHIVYLSSGSGIVSTGDARALYDFQASRSSF